MKLRYLMLALIVVVSSSLLFAGTDRPAPHKEKTVTLYSDAKVGDKILPKGEYEVKHVVEGQDNFLVFVSGRKEYRFPCHLQPADRVESVSVHFRENPDGTRTLVSIMFPGDSNAHVF